MYSGDICISGKILFVIDSVISFSTLSFAKSQTYICGA